MGKIQDIMNSDEELEVPRHSQLMRKIVFLTYPYWIDYWFKIQKKTSLIVYKFNIDY